MHEIENLLTPGTYPRLSLGPGQRYAAKGAGIITTDRDHERVLSGSRNNN